MMPAWWPALLLAVVVALTLPGPPATRRLRRQPDGGRGRLDRLLRPVPGACDADTRARVAITAAATGALLAIVSEAIGMAALLAGALGVAGYVVAARIVTPAERRRRRRRRGDLPGVLELMASSLRAGLPVRGAAAAVAAATAGPLAEDIDQVLAQIAIGDAESRAWLRLADDPVWGPVARDLARSVESGTALVELLLSHARRARREHHAAVIASARTVGVRSVLPLMACYLPAFLLVGIVPVVAGTIPTLLG